MANIKRLYVFLTGFISGIGVLFTVVSLATEEWVVSDSLISTNTNLNEHVKYGLFQGTHKTTSPIEATLQISMTCLFDKNVCAVLCAGNSEVRYDLLRALYNNTADITQPYYECPSVRTRWTNFVPRTAVPLDASSGNSDKKFINAGVWLSTIIFLALSLLFGVIATILAVYNTVSNPVEVYLSIFGLYIYNGIASFCTVVAMALWGGLFTVTIFHDIGIFKTLNGEMDSDKRSGLGYSYWLLIIPVFLYIASNGVLYLRHWLISKDPVRKFVQQEESADPVLYLF